jgi:AraC-like DNA-binding protein
MNSPILKITPDHDHSFSAKKDVVHHFINKWHFHSEVELIHIVEGRGLQFVGDDIRRFSKDDLILIGSSLPHFWRCDDMHLKNKQEVYAMATVVHFKDDFWGPGFLQLAENAGIKALLHKAERGIVIRGSTKQIIIEKMQQLLSAREIDRIILLLQILKEISKSEDVELLSPPGFQPRHLTDSEKIEAVYEYSLENFRKKIYLDEVARVANVSANYFCRYFKSHTRKTYNHFMQEIRVGYASKLLVENRKAVSEVCDECGFSNVSNFYKSFKKITGKSPVAYQRIYLEPTEVF